MSKGMTERIKNIGERERIKDKFRQGEMKEEIG